MDARRVIRPLQAKLDEVKTDGLDVMLCSTEIIENVISLLKEHEGEWLDVDDEQNAFDCSICGAMVGRKCLYCPGCGAKMKNGTRAIVCV